MRFRNHLTLVINAGGLTEITETNQRIELTVYNGKLHAHTHTHNEKRRAFVAKNDGSGWESQKNVGTRKGSR